MRSEIRRLHDEFRITTVYVTHDQSEAMVTSDRIVVMNAGRIEQAADPVTLYTRPQTRFVAGFVGRTNFLDGVLSGTEIRFPGFTVPASTRARHGRPPPQLLRPPAEHPPAHDRPGRPRRPSWWVQGDIVERAYLGEYWDYVVTPAEGGLRLKVTTSPAARHDIGTRSGSRSTLPPPPRSPPGVTDTLTPRGQACLRHLLRAMRPYVSPPAPASDTSSVGSRFGCCSAGNFRAGS